MNRLRRIALTGFLPAALALLVAVVVLGIVLRILGVDPVKSLVALFDFGETPGPRRTRCAHGSTVRSRCSCRASR